MSKTTASENEDALILCKLSLERCHVYLAHLCACVHLADPGDGMLEIIAGLERELTISQTSLERTE